ncbi:MAG: bifunctional histidinol-phosphatase/imidazoleglycerol-phosphate dehydratase HisB [Bacteroidia bacterium]|nr:bifunctional histidinol-phosphatase/imidazoleglycerol-phosphate dehydratase HisB [Bacteroidia bacterium]
MKKRILFLDRDGTLIKEPPEDYQVDSLEKLAYIPGVIREMVRITEGSDFVWVMITNQDGLGTEGFPEEGFWAAHNQMMALFEGEGIHFDEVIIDRTYKAEGKPTRKPGTALLTHYMDGSYDLENSFVVGDRPSDIQLAKNLGAKGILIGRSIDDQDDEWDLSELKKDTLVLETENWREIADFLLSAGRRASIHRKTKETDIKIELDLDGNGKTDNQTGIGFFDHMLDQLGKHSGINLKVSAKGDLHIDPHHTIEDTGIALGEAFFQALGDKRGINRYGCFNLPMDEALTEVAIDFSGRPWLVWAGEIKREKVGDFPVEMLEHFFKSFCDGAKCNLNVRMQGSNAHHMIEATFKGVAKAIKLAIRKEDGNNDLPTTKGML